MQTWLVDLATLAGPFEGTLPENVRDDLTALWIPATPMALKETIQNRLDTNRNQALWVIQDEVPSPEELQNATSIRFGVRFMGFAPAEMQKKLEVLRRIFLTTSKPLFILLGSLEIDDMLHFAELAAPFADTLILEDSNSLEALLLYREFDNVRRLISA
jgi:hypothetical protein